VINNYLGWWNILQAGCFSGVTVQVEDHGDDVVDGGETVALSVQHNSCSFMDDFFKQVMLITFWHFTFKKLVDLVRNCHVFVCC